MPPNIPVLHQSSSQNQIDNNQLISNYNIYDKNQISPQQNNINATNLLSSSNNIVLNYIDSNLDHQFIDTAASFNTVNNSLNNKYLSQNQSNSNNINAQNICNSER